MNGNCSSGLLARVVSNDNDAPCQSRGLQRMRKAVSEMAANLQTQQEAVSAFQSNIRGLREEIDLLGANMRTFNHNLRTIKMEPLGRKARRLAAMMAMIERSPAE